VKLASSECRDLADLSSKVASALGSTNASDVEKTSKLLNGLADKAPSDIKGDFKVIADAYSKIASVVKDLKPGQQPTADQLAKLQQLQTQIDTTKLTQASTHIEAWVKQHCGTG
jgi:hypothetical protein